MSGYQTHKPIEMPDDETVSRAVMRIAKVPPCVECGERVMQLPHSYCRPCLEERRRRRAQVRESER